MSTKVSSRPGINKEALTQKQNISKVVGNTKSTESCGKRESNHVSCIPSIKRENKINKRNCIHRVAVNKRPAGGCRIRLPRSEFSVVRFFKHLSSKMASGLCFAYFNKRHSPAVSSSGRPKPSEIPVDSHRTKAIEDCIEFINSSSSLPRSNSVSTNASNSVSTNAS